MLGAPRFPKEASYHYTVECNFCGYVKVLPTKSDLEMFVGLHAVNGRPLDEWSKNVLRLERSLASFQKQLKPKRRVRSVKKVPVSLVKKTITQPDDGDLITAIKAEPTEAQRRRGATHPVDCTVCGQVTFRRKKELEIRKIAYCSPECRKSAKTSQEARSPKVALRH